MSRSPARRLATLSLLGLLGLSLTTGLGCRRTQSPDGEQPDTAADGDAAAIGLPAPLPLPEHPRLGTWVAQPNLALAMLQPYSPAPINVEVLAQAALRDLTEAELAELIATGIDLKQPFSNVILDDGQEVIRMGLTPAARAALAAHFAGLEPAGAFGGVKLPPPTQGREGGPDGTWLAWIDVSDGGYLVLANSEAGLATGRALAEAYGRQPVFVSADPRQLPMPAEIPIARVEAQGTLDALAIDVQTLPGQDPLAGQPIAPGTLAGLLAGPGIVAGLSSTYADYDQVVSQITSEVNGQVRELPFLIRGIGEDLAASLGTLLRTWDGRSLVALGPANHLRVAYGASNVDKSRVAMIRLLQKVIDNASLARNFTNSVPNMSLRRRVAKANGVDIELFTLARAASFVPPEARALIDKEGRLGVAMAWSDRAGGGLLVIGPDAANELASWLEDTASASPHTETKAQLIAGVFAADPAELQSVMVPGQNPDVAKLMGLGADGPRWSAEITPAGTDRYTITLTTPGAPKPARAAI